MNLAYDLTLEGSQNNIDYKKLKDDVLVNNASKSQVQALLELMHEKDFKVLDSITFSIQDNAYKKVKKAVKKQFKVVKAGGGIVQKGDEILLIFRKGKWDLPKGKLDKGETKKEGAVREVEEECNVKVKAIESKITSTWHTYIRNGKKHLKKTYWYRMSLQDDSQMKPQLDESITEVCWMNDHDVRQAMVNSYPSIRHVVKKHHDLCTKLI